MNWNQQALEEFFGTEFDFDESTPGGTAEAQFVAYGLSADHETSRPHFLEVREGCKGPDLARNQPMKTRNLILQIVMAVMAAAGTARSAPVSITTPAFTYNQTFDSLGIITIPEFVNDSTLPGWFAQYNNGTTPNGPVTATDGSGTVQVGFLNLGWAYWPDRALGTKAGSFALSSYANCSLAVSFQNNSGKAVKMSSLHYEAELWRNITVPGNREHWGVFYQVSAAAVTNILSGPSGATPVAGTGFTAFAPSYGSPPDWVSPAYTTAGVPLDGNAAANRAAIDYIPTAEIVIPAGQFFMVKWTDPNEGGNDGYQGIDNVSISFVEAGLVATAAGPATRNTQGTGDPTDDTYTVPVSVTTSSATATGWTSNSTPAAGLLNAVTTFGPYPVGSPPPTVNFTTVGHTPGPELTTALLLTVPPAPLWVGQNLLGPPAPILVAVGRQAKWVQLAAALPAVGGIELNNGGLADQVAVTENFALTSAGDKCVSLDLEYWDDSASSNSESTDTALVELVTNLGTTNMIRELDTDGDGRMNGASVGLLNGATYSKFKEDEFNPLGVAWSPTNPGPTVFLAPDTGKFIQTWKLVAIIPSAAASAYIRITGHNDASTEHLRVRNILLRPCADSDGDGVNDAQEEADGTDPQNGFDYLHYTDSPFHFDGAGFTAHVAGVPARWYQLESSDDFIHWTRAANPARTSADPFSNAHQSTTTAGEVEITYDGSGLNRRFLRVRALIPPTILP